MSAVAGTPFFYLYDFHIQGMKTMLTILSCFLAALLTHGQQYTLTEGCREAQDLISSLRFEQAREVLNEERQKDPSNLFPVALDGYIDFLVVVIDEDRQVYDSLKGPYQEKIKIIQRGNRQSPWYRSLLARMNLQWAFAQLKFGGYLNAALDISRAYHLLEDNAGLHPGFPPDQVGLGLLHALIGSIPESYRWITGLFSMEGSVEEGRKELMQVLLTAGEEGFPGQREEALFFLTYIDLNLQPDKERSLELLPVFDNMDGESLLLLFAKVRILMQNARNDEAIELLVNRPAGKEYHPFYYLDYLAGQAKLNRLDPDANRYFLRYVTNFRGNSYVKAAYQKVAWYWLLQGEPDKYHDQMEKALRYGDAITDADRIAYSDALTGTVPDLCLLKARLLFDGGYYQEADSTLKDAACMPENKRDSLEWPYRMGRILHASGNQAAALEYYDRVIIEGAEEPYYFAANAALQSGNIYETMGEHDKAVTYYRKCLKLPNEEYRASLQQKARAGLNRIREKKKDAQ